MKFKDKPVFQNIIELASLTTILLILILLEISPNEKLIQNNKVKYRASSQIADAIYKSCHNVNTNYGCFHDKISQLAEKSDFNQALQVLREIQKVSPQLTYCHGIGHKLSIIAVQKNPNNWLDHLKYVSPYECSSGFLHGTIEGLLHIDQGFSLNSQTSEDICKKMSNSVEYPDSNQIKKIQNSCMHSMGHVLLVTNNANVDSALSNCPSSSNEFQYSCSKGIFMENFSRENLVFHGITKPIVVNNEEIKRSEEKCGEYQDSSAAIACWEAISTLFVYITNGNYQEVLKYCKHAPEEDLSFKCYLRGAGEILSRHSINLQQIENRGLLCSPFTKVNSFYAECINFILTHELESQFTESAIEFCESIVESHINYCFERLIGYSDVLLNKEEKARFCSISVQNYKNLPLLNNLCSGLKKN